MNCITLNFIYCIGWLHNLASAPVLNYNTHCCYSLSHVLVAWF